MYSIWTCKLYIFYHNFVFHLPRFIADHLDVVRLCDQQGCHSIGISPQIQSWLYVCAVEQVLWVSILHREQYGEVCDSIEFVYV